MRPLGLRFKPASGEFAGLANAGASRARASAASAARSFSAAGISGVRETPEPGPPLVPGLRRRCSVVSCGSLMAGLAKPPRDIVIGSAVLGGSEDLLRGTDLDEFAKIHESSHVGDAGCLLQVVRDDSDAVGLAQAL